MLLAQQFPGLSGFLGTRGSFMLDFVFVAMFAVVPLLGWSIYLVKRGRFELHKRMQITLGVVLLVAVTAFEIDVQYLTADWELRAIPSPYFDAEQKWNCTVGRTLIVHLLFAVPTAILWVWTIVEGLRRFPSPIRPSPYSGRHRLLARLAAGGMLMTALTGWLFYWLAFVA